MKSYAKHKISSVDNLGFSPKDYSMFKFGDKTIARTFGYALADSFIRNVIGGSEVVNEFYINNK